MCVKLQQVQRNYRLRNQFGMRVTSLTPVENCWNRVNKSKVWIRHRFIVLKSLGIDCGSRKCSKDDVSVGFWNGFTSLTSTLNTKLSLLLAINSLQGRFFQELWLEIFRRQKNQFGRQNLISYVLMVSMMFMCFSNDNMVQWQSLSYI